MLRLDGGINLRVLNFKQNLLLPFLRNLLFETVDRLANLDSPQLGCSGLLNWLYGGIPGLSGSSSRKIGLMFFTLRMSHVAAFI